MYNAIATKGVVLFICFNGHGLSGLGDSFATNDKKKSYEISYYWKSQF